MLWYYGILCLLWLTTINTICYGKNQTLLMWYNQDGVVPRTWAEIRYFTSRIGQQETSDDFQIVGIAWSSPEMIEDHVPACIGDPNLLCQLHNRFELLVQITAQESPSAFLSPERRMSVSILLMMWNDASCSYLVWCCILFVVPRICWMACKQCLWVKEVSDYNDMPASPSKVQDGCSDVP